MVLEELILHLTQLTYSSVLIVVFVFLLQDKSLVGKSALLYNEFIVYDVKQVRMKYLVKLKFKYRSGW